MIALCEEAYCYLNGKGTQIPWNGIELMAKNVKFCTHPHTGTTPQQSMEMNTPETTVHRQLTKRSPVG